MSKLFKIKDEEEIMSNKKSPKTTPENETDYLLAIMLYTLNNYNLHMMKKELKQIHEDYEAKDDICDKLKSFDLFLEYLDQLLSEK